MTDDAPDFNAPKDTPAVDRGLFRGAVELFAKQRKIPYQHAHDMLSGKGAVDAASYRESGDNPDREDWFDVPSDT